MRFPRLRRRRTRRVEFPFPFMTTAANSSGALTVTAANATATAAPIAEPPPQPPTRRREPMSVEVTAARLERRLLRTTPLSAGQLARRANLVSADGSGRGIAKAIATLVSSGKAKVHGRSGHRTYTRA